ncbi:MAG: chemotaxis response regulator protein-glutamate methylesterase [Acidobacteria bacterium]|nr:MAG: chemotaxis response regulator protein-glutamate methylesterase [Acidobacteriota bacterium]
MIKALVVDDSAYNRVSISRMLESDSRIKVVATAINGEDAIKQVMRHEPDVITLDLEMPVMDGFSFLRWLMQNRPTAVIAVSSRSNDRSVFKALELGAIDFIAKPGGNVSPRLEEIQTDLVSKVLQIGDLRIENIKKRVEAGFSPPAPAEAGAYTLIQLVAIGCSTGGPPALQHLFESLPLLPLPIVVAQSKYAVKEAVHGEPLGVGVVYVAPGGMVTEVQRSADGLRARIVAPGPNDLYAPSVDRLFGSASDTCGERMIAVIMTGMGDDGAEAIRKVRQRGGKTIAESPDTAIIFGMPNQAIKTGAVDQVLPLNEIAGAIERLCYPRVSRDERRIES